MTFRPLKVVALDLERPLETIDNLDGYGALFALVRVRGLPVGTVQVPLRDGRCDPDALGNVVLAKHWRDIVRRLVQCALRSPLPSGGLRIEELLAQAHPKPLIPNPLVTVAVCTRDRPKDLSTCLDSLLKLDYPALDLLVVDNAPSSEATRQLVEQRFPSVRYVREERPGLDWARNRAILEARAQLIAFADDDVVADPNWIGAIVAVFEENPDVMAVTGLVMPYELETEAQWRFEEYGGFARGFERRDLLLKRRQDRRGHLHIGSGQFGTGANMAFRKRIFEAIGGFDPALDAGTATTGGGDLEMFFRVLQEGYPLVYEPAALVWHRHRREDAELKQQIRTWGTGFYSYLVRTRLVYPELRTAVTRFGVWWLWWRYIYRFARPLSFRPAKDQDLLLAEFKGVFAALFRYRRARAQAARIAKSFGSLPPGISALRAAQLHTRPLVTKLMGVKLVDLAQPLRDMTDVEECSDVRVFVSWQDRLLGDVTISDHAQRISAEYLRDRIARKISLKLFEAAGEGSHRSLEMETLAALQKHCLPGRAAPAPASRSSRRLPGDVSVSIVVATCDRPQSLRNCLTSLLSQKTTRSFEIIVVDNHPASNLTAPIVAEFPDVVLVAEPRQGASYARNAGIQASRAEIVVCTDDDVVAPPGWLERLIAPFSCSEVMAVTGNVLPGELETRAQQLFETYGGLSRGYERFEADASWFASFSRRAVPTWRLGATANAAFRVTIFSHPQIGLMDEALGPGTPSGCSEDTYLFYKVLKAGYRIVYEPHAYVWHTHRRNMRALRRQLYDYSKGHVAYHLTTLLRDGDRRALTRLLVELPLIYLRRVWWWLRGWNDYPLSLICLEVAGNFVGPFALWRARRKVVRLGRSEPYVPVSERNCRSAPAPAEADRLRVSA